MATRALMFVNHCPVFRKWVDDTTGGSVTSTKFLGITAETLRNSRCTQAMNGGDRLLGTDEPVEFER